MFEVRARILDLPPSSGRKYSDNILFWHNVVSRERILDPDFYIIYRVGIVTRLWALIFSASAFGIAYAHHSYGALPELVAFYDKPTLLGTFIGLINIAGRLMVVILIYYLVLFFRNVDFRQHNPLRYDYQTMKGRGLKPLIQFYGSTVLLALLLTFIGYSFGYFTTLENTQGIYNSGAFVFLLIAPSTFFLSLISQVLFLITIQTIYITEEWMGKYD